MSKEQIAAVVTLLESLPEPAQARAVEHLRDYLADLQTELHREQTGVYASTSSAADEYAIDLLPELDAQLEALAREREAFEQLKPQLKKTYAGQWVAIHDQHVVDCDEQAQALKERVEGQFSGATYFEKVPAG